MFSPVALFLFVITVVELFVMVQLASVFGALPTAFFLIALSILGVVVLRKQGAGFFRSTISSVANGDSLVADKIANRALVLAACLLLVLPGFVSAVLAILLFVPPIRALARPAVRSRIQTWIRPYQRFGRSVVDVDSVVVDADSVPRDAYPPAQRELG